MVNHLIGLTIALLPLFTKIAEFDVSRLSKDNLLLIIMMAFCFILPDKKRKLPVIGYVGLTYGLFSIVYNQWNPISIMVQLQSFYLAAGMVFFCCFYERFDFKNISAILNGMALGCLIQSILVILSSGGVQLYPRLFEFFYSDLKITNMDAPGIGSLGNTNTLAAYVSITSIALMRDGFKKLLFLPVIALLIANSLMGYVTILGGALYLINLKLNILKKYQVYLLTSLSMVGAVVFGVGGMDTKRFAMWKKIVSNMDFPHFLFGKGPGWFYDQSFVNGSEIAIQEHNELISAINIFGIIGVMLLVLTFARFFTRSDKSKVFPAILFASFINSFGHFTLHQSTTAIIVIVSAAICLAEGEKICHRRGTAAP